MVLFNIHNPLIFAFGILGNVISVFVYLAPLPTFYRVYKKKSTEGFRCLPYLVALFSSMLWLYYAYLKKDAILLVTINSFGCVIESIYIIMYFFYAPKKAKKSTLVIFTAMNLGLFSLLILITQFLPIHQRAVVFGWICVAVSVSVFAAPLSVVAQVIRTKSVEFMPFYLSFFLTLSAIMWFGYGLLLRDLCIALPNVLGFLLGISQMLVYGIYKRAGNKGIIMETKLSKDIVLNPLGTNNGIHEVVLDVKFDDGATRDQQPQEAENDCSKNEKPSKKDDSGDNNNDNDIPRNDSAV